MTSAASDTSAFDRSRPISPRKPTSDTLSVFRSYYVQTMRSNWCEQLKERLDELTALPVGWDGYAGRPVSFQCAHFVVSMLERIAHPGVPAPSLVPGSDGSLQVEWHRNMFDVELDVLDAQHVVATRFNRQTNEEEVIQINNDFSEIVSWVTGLADVSVSQGQGM